MRLLSLFTVIIFYYNVRNTEASIDSEELRCLVCKKSLDELSKAVSKLDPTKKVDIGGYQLDPKGNYKRKAVSQAKSEIHLSEVVEEICNKMDDYVRATFKKNGTLTLLQLIVDGKMNADMSEVDIVQDDDLNKSLKYYCEDIMGEFEDSIIKEFQADSTDIHKKICLEESKICSFGPENLGYRTEEL